MLGELARAVRNLSKTSGRTFGMIYIADEDIRKITMGVEMAIMSLGKGAKRIDLDVDIGDQLNPIEVSGYWAGDMMRIDVKVKVEDANSK